MTITVDKKNDEFFIALCKYDVHSYVALGVKQKDGVSLLAGFGALCARDTEASCADIAKKFALFFAIGTRAVVVNENILGTSSDSNGSTVSYKAYAISYQQYLDFIEHLETVSFQQKGEHGSQTEELEAYVPSPENPYTLEKCCLDKKIHEDSVKNSFQEIKISFYLSSCRKHAKGLTALARGTANTGKGVSAWWFKNLPLTAKFHRGKVVSPNFYILPLPPTAYKEVDKPKRVILEKLYSRMDKLIMNKPESELTKKKFDELKSLYQQITKGLDTDINDIMRGIHDWEETNAELIKKHRNFHVFPFATATEKMFKQLHKEVAVLTSPSSVA